MTCAAGQPKVKIGNSWYDCRTDGERITVNGFDGFFICPTPFNKWCSQVPNYPSWPRFISISPPEGTVGDQVTVEVLGMDATVTGVLFGLEHGCSSSMSVSLEGTKAVITCKIGEIAGAKTLRGEQQVDVVVQDDQGRTATGIKQFILSSSPSSFSHLTSIASVFLVTLLVLM
jgi:hypothetical protein